VTPIDALLQTTVFGELARERIAALLPAMRMHSLARGQLAFAQGDPADAMFVVAEGPAQAVHRRPATVPNSSSRWRCPANLFGQVGVFRPERPAAVPVPRPWCPAKS
jgi:CRP-like cAMP-binding protein